MTIFLLLLVHRKVYDNFLTNSRYSIDFGKYMIAVNPNWLIDEDIKNSVNETMVCDIKTSLFDNTLIPKLREHYENNPWVREIKAIERRLPNDVKINLELRRPYVAILKTYKGADTYYLVDKNSVRLPGEYKNVPAMPLSIPIVTGIRNNPPVAGEIWKDKGLHSALDIVANLESNKLLEPLQLNYIDVANIDGKRNPRETEIVMFTKSKVRIEWGRNPDTEKFGELAVSDKIKNIKLVLEVCPELNGIKYIKVQFDQPYIALEK
jgi:hypothetical protein